jgi:hypothetical protein
MVKRYLLHEIKKVIQVRQQSTRTSTVDIGALSENK